MGCSLPLKPLGDRGSQYNQSHSRPADNLYAIITNARKPFVQSLGCLAAVKGRPAGSNSWQPGSQYYSHGALLVSLSCLAGKAGYPADNLLINITIGMKPIV